LNWSQEFRQLALLTCDDIETATLNTHQLVEQARHLLLIRRCRRELGAQCLPSLSLFPKESDALPLELLVYRLQTGCLGVVQLESTPHDLRTPLPEATLELLPLRTELPSARRIARLLRVQHCDSS
jgi:hypothetical protein